LTPSSTLSLHAALPISLQGGSPAPLLRAPAGVTHPAPAVSQALSLPAGPCPADAGLSRRILQCRAGYLGRSALFAPSAPAQYGRSEEHTSELQSRENLV